MEGDSFCSWHSFRVHSKAFWLISWMKGLGKPSQKTILAEPLNSIPEYLILRPSGRSMETPDKVLKSAQGAIAC